MEEKNNICTICGPRPHKLPLSLKLDKLLAALEDEIRRAYAYGYRVFLSGSAMGVDIWAGEIIYRLKEDLPFIQCHIYMPYEGQANHWNDEWRKRYFNLHEVSDEVYCLQFDYTSDCMHKRNRVMVDKSSRVIAVHDGTQKGGTAYTIGYAKEKGIEIVTLNPQDFC